MGPPPNVATALNNLAHLLQATNRPWEAKPMLWRALAIDEQSYGANHPDVARDLNNLALLLQDTNRLGEAELLMRLALAIFLDFTRRTGHPHPHLNDAIKSYGRLPAKQASGRSRPTPGFVNSPESMGSNGEGKRVNEE